MFINSVSSQLKDLLCGVKVSVFLEPVCKERKAAGWLRGPWAAGGPGHWAGVAQHWAPPLAGMFILVIDSH